MVAHFGIYAESGGIERDTALCALTGQPIGAGGVTCRITGTRLFYRLSVTARRRITIEQRQQIEASIRAAYDSETKPKRRSVQKEEAVDADDT